MLDLLIHSLDNELTPSEQATLNQALKEIPELRKEQDKLLKLRDLLAQSKPSSNAYFAEEVMGKIKRVQQEGILNFNARIVSLFPRVAAACIALMLISWGIIYFSGDNFATETLIGIENLYPEDAYAYLQY